MNTKFTKGPWAIDRGNAGPSVYNWTASNDNAQHAEYFRIVDPSRQHAVAMAVFASDAFGDSPENAANAALMAESPNLYKALEVLAAYPLEAFGKYGAKPDTPLVGSKGWLLTVGDVLNARTALKKARGEA